MVRFRGIVLVLSWLMSRCSQVIKSSLNGKITSQQFKCLEHSQSIEMIFRLITFFAILLLSYAAGSHCTGVPVRGEPVNPPPGFLVSLENPPVVERLSTGYNTLRVIVKDLVFKGYRGDVKVVFDIQQEGNIRQRSRVVKLLGGAQPVPELQFDFPLTETRVSRRPAEQIMNLENAWSGCLAVFANDTVFARKCFDYSNGSFQAVSNDGFVAEGKIVSSVAQEQKITERDVQGSWKMKQSNELRGNYNWIFAAGSLVLQEDIGPQARLPRDYQGKYKIEGKRLVITVDGIFNEALFAFDGNRLVDTATETVLIRMNRGGTDVTE